MRYYFIAFIMAMNTIIQNAPPQDARSRLNTQSPALQAARMEGDIHSSAHNRNIIHTNKSITCADLLECISCCCHATFILTKICFESMRKGPQLPIRDHYQTMHERSDHR